jgi:hypothetical protein
MKTSQRLGSVFLFAVVLASACRESTPPPFDQPVDTVGTGGRSSKGGSRGTASGGAAGMKAGGAGAGGMAGAAAGPADSGAAGAAEDAMVIVDAEPPPADAPAATPDAVVMPDAGPPVVGTGLAACYPDPKVIKICHQLEAACQNCPGGPNSAMTQQCFAAVEKKNDAACEKFAIDHKCPVDDPMGKGNVCGSLNCGVGSGPPVAAGCDKVACAKAQGEGNSAMCMPLLAKCPCK